ncbi:MAG TPA: lyase family protein [Chloroflexota bacterium]|nr:lyase family protein [Chloroflexota bacterium]
MSDTSRPDHIAWTVSPLDYRYYGASEKLYPKVHPYLSEEANLRYFLRVEAALARGLAEVGVCTPADAEEIARACGEVTFEEVHEEEKRTDHNVRALVNCISRRVGEHARPYIHLGATSSDVWDTATALRLRDFTREVLVPELRALVAALIELAREHRDTVQIGRTHGQHAVPITFGFAIAQYVDRVGGRLLEIERAAGAQRGLLSGAVGAYNAMSVIVPDPLALERAVLAQLGIEPARISTQIAPPEPLADLVHAVLSCFGVLANLADDMRHLQRTEIGEIKERFLATQVGSSTMPHKQNPWNFEHVKSMWKEFAPRMAAVYANQISEHQRDLTNTASTRFVPEIFVGFLDALDRMVGLIRSTDVNAERMQANLAMSRGLFVAEPLYIILALHGVGDAHEVGRRLSLTAREKGISVLEAAAGEPFFDQLTDAERRILAEPERYYTGLAARKVDQVCDHWAEMVALDEAIAATA